MPRVASGDIEYSAIRGCAVTGSTPGSDCACTGAVRMSASLRPE